MWTRTIRHCLSFGLVLTLAAGGSLLGQRYGKAEQAQSKAPAELPGPMLDYLGAIGDVPSAMPLERGAPIASATDTYYYDLSLLDMMPDEFASNPDSEFDWRELKAWHVAPLLKEMRIIGNRRIEAGESITLEAVISDPTGTTRSAYLSYYGPKGRRTTMRANLEPIAPGSSTLRGSLKLGQWAEPGVYRHIRFSANNEVRSSKIFWSDHHPAMRGQPLEFEVLPNPNADVTPPKMQWIKVGSMDPTEGEVHTQSILDPVPIYAHVTDNNSGVKRIWTRWANHGSNVRFQQVDLRPLMGTEDVYVAYLTFPKWWEGGEYQMTSFITEDNNGQEATHLFGANPWVRAAKVNLIQDPEMVDNTPPQLISIWADKKSSMLGQSVKISAIVIDDKADVVVAEANFQHIPSFVSKGKVVLRRVTNPDVIQKAGMDVNQNLFEGELPTTIWQEPGTWQLTRFFARDRANNHLDMLYTEYPDLASVTVEMGGGVRLREKMLAAISEGGEIRTPAAQAAPAAYSAPTTSRAPATAGKIRRIDMTPPHPPRGQCLNCHEP